MTTAGGVKGDSAGSTPTIVNSLLLANERPTPSLARGSTISGVRFSAVADVRRSHVGEHLEAAVYPPGRPNRVDLRYRSGARVVRGRFGPGCGPRGPAPRARLTKGTACGQHKAHAPQWWP